MKYPGARTGFGRPCHQGTVTVPCASYQNSPLRNLATIYHFILFEKIFIFIPMRKLPSITANKDNGMFGLGKFYIVIEFHLNMGVKEPRFWTTEQYLLSQNIRKI